MSDNTNVMASADISEAAAAHKRQRTGHKPVVVVAGPTASGKSALAARLAREFGGVVINADSMQVYRDLPILTAQPGGAEHGRRAAPALWLPGAGRCVLRRTLGHAGAARDRRGARWRQAAGAVRRHRALSARLDAGLLARSPMCPRTCARRRAICWRRSDRPALRERLAVGDPASAARLHANDRQRIVRAWEVLQATGRPLSEWQALPPVCAGRSVVPDLGAAAGARGALSGVRSALPCHAGAGRAG